MSNKRKNDPDPMRRLALLWGSHTEPGRSGLTVQAIVETAIEIADANGLDAVSMRKVAEKLDAGTMSLYTHVPSKTELIDLMFDGIYNKLYDSVEQPSQQPRDWRDAMRYIAQRNLDLYLQHIWLLDIPSGRPVLGPHTSLKYEAELRPLDKIGLSDVEMDATLALILTHVEGCARSIIRIEQTQKNTGMTVAEWWVAQSPLLEKVVNPEHFPVATRVGTAAGEAYEGASDPNYTFTFGLESILTGIAILIQSKQVSRSI